MPELHVAAAANLTRVLPQIGAQFERKTRIHVIPSYAATAQLTQQIENGAPYEVFLAADVEHVDQLVKGGFALPDSRVIYARGELVVWAPKRPGLRTLNGLAEPDIRAIAVAKPELAPYGEAAVEALKKAGLWDRVEKKVVYAPSVAIAKQFGDTGNADAALTALALVINESGNYFAVDEKLHAPIDQALCIMKNSAERQSARAFVSYLASEEGRSLLNRFGYVRP